MGEFSRGNRILLTVALILGIVGVVLTSILFPSLVN